MSEWIQKVWLGVKQFKKVSLLLCFQFLLFLNCAVASTADYQYDDLNRLIQVNYSDGTAVTYTYDEVGNRTSKVILKSTSTDVKANGFDGYTGEPIIVNAGSDLSITVEISSRGLTGQDADWWILLGLPNNYWFHYEGSGNSWQPGFATTYQKPLEDLSTEVLNMSTLQIGIYTFLVGFDTVMNGTFDAGQSYMDSVVVIVKNP